MTPRPGAATYDDVGSSLEMLMFLLRRYRFEAARRLDRLPGDHPCSRLHGTSFELVIQIEGSMDERIGWIMDYADLDDLVAPTLDRLDHRFLNEIPGLESPTTEHIAQWIVDDLGARLPGLRRVELWESPGAACVIEVS